MGIGTNGEAPRRTDTVLKKGMKRMNQYDGFEYVEVKYTTNDGVTGGRAYTYKTKLNLRLGQKVYAPTYKSDRSEAVVVAVNCPEPPFKCKEIVEVMPEEGNADA